MSLVLRWSRQYPPLVHEHSLAHGRNIDLDTLEQILGAGTR